MDVHARQLAVISWWMPEMQHAHVTNDDVEVDASHHGILSVPLREDFSALSTMC